MTGNLDRASLFRALKLSSIIALVAVAGCQKQPEPANVAADSAPNQTMLNFLSYQSPGDRIFFDYDSAAITPEAKAITERWAAYAKAHPEWTFIIEGHCDERGTREYNLALGARRAEAARATWVALGTDPARLRTVSYGNERPAVLGQSEAAWAQNRRAVAVRDQ
jgi:peptidoglycan-associated lipoprotein